MQTSYRSLLRTPGTRAFLATLFLGALNDNIFKMVLSLRVLAMAASTGQAGSAVAFVGAVFMLPFLLGSGYAGYLADRFSKRQVMIAAKGLEIVAMLLAVPAFLLASNAGLIAVLALMALQSTFFGPAKNGILPEIFGEKELTRANGLVEGATFLAIILGTALGGVLHGALSARPGMLAMLLVFLACVGTLTSLGIRRVSPAAEATCFRVNPFHQLGAGLRVIRSRRILLHSVLGITLFWFLGALVQMNLLLLAKQSLGFADSMVGALAAVIAFGIGGGSLLAGRLSGERIEPGLVPIGLAGMAVSSLAVALLAASEALAMFSLFTMGVAGGFFSVPLYAMLQHHSPRAQRGQVLATANALSTIAMLLASVVLHLAQGTLGLGPLALHLFIALVALVATVHALRLVPEFVVRFLAWMVMHVVYRIRIEGRENIPQRGPALLVVNHLSFVDSLLVASCIQRFVRFLAYRGVCEQPLLGHALRWMHAIPVDGKRPRAIVGAIRRSRRELEAGHVVGIFAEGRISRDGTLGEFRPGLERIARDLTIPVIPVRLEGVWGSIFSFSGGRAFWKWPRRLPYPVTVRFGDPLPSSVSAAELREVLVTMGEAAA